MHVDGDATLDGQVTNQGALSVVVNGSLRIGTIGELQAETLIVDVDELELRGRLVARGTVATGAAPLAAGGIDCETKSGAGYQLSVLANVSASIGELGTVAGAAVRVCAVAGLSDPG